MKYYLVNEIRFLVGLMEDSVTPISATHMKHAQALAFIGKHPKYICYKERTSPKGNDYVICTKIKFVGNDLTSVDSMQKAKSFDSAEAAYEFLQKNRSVIDEDIIYVVNEKFQRKKLVVPAVENCNNKSLIYSGMNSSKRISFPQEVKDEVFRQSGGYCAICGGKLYKQNMSVDHIVPLSRGGTNTLTNLRATHEGCNYLKGNFMDDEMFQLIANITMGKIQDDPTGNISRMFTRGMVRSLNAKYGGAVAAN